MRRTKGNKASQLPACLPTKHRRASPHFQAATVSQKRSETGITEPPVFTALFQLHEPLVRQRLRRGRAVHIAQMPLFQEAASHEPVLLVRLPRVTPPTPSTGACETKSGQRAEARGGCGRGTDDPQAAGRPLHTKWWPSCRPRPRGTPRLRSAEPTGKAAPGQARLGAPSAAEHRRLGGRRRRRAE